LKGKGDQITLDPGLAGSCGFTERTLFLRRSSSIGRESELGNLITFLLIKLNYPWFVADDGRRSSISWQQKFSPLVAAAKAAVRRELN
jgi:hypothetical protein